MSQHEASFGPPSQDILGIMNINSQPGLEWPEPSIASQPTVMADSQLGGSLNLPTFSQLQNASQLSEGQFEALGPPATALGLGPSQPATTAVLLPAPAVLTTTLPITTSPFVPAAPAGPVPLQQQQQLQQCVFQPMLVDHQGRATAPAPKHPSLEKPEHKNSKANRRGPMDEMRQLVRIMVKLFPESARFLAADEGGGGNRVSEDQIKDYLKAMGLQQGSDAPPGSPPYPEWGLNCGWGEYLARLFRWARDLSDKTALTREDAMKCAQRLPGRSWEVVDSELANMKVCCSVWPLPLRRDLVRKAQEVYERTGSLQEAHTALLTMGGAVTPAACSDPAAGQQQQQSGQNAGLTVAATLQGSSPSVAAAKRPADGQDPTAGTASAAAAAAYGQAPHAKRRKQIKGGAGMHVDPAELNELETMHVILKLAETLPQKLGTTPQHQIGDLLSSRDQAARYLSMVRGPAVADTGAVSAVMLSNGQVAMMQSNGQVAMMQRQATQQQNYIMNAVSLPVPVSTANMMAPMAMTTLPPIAPLNVASGSQAAQPAATASVLPVQHSPQQHQPQQPAAASQAAPSAAAAPTVVKPKAVPSVPPSDDSKDTSSSREPSKAADDVRIGGRAAGGAFRTYVADDKGKASGSGQAGLDTLAQAAMQVGEGGSPASARPAHDAGAGGTASEPDGGRAPSSAQGHAVDGKLKAGSGSGGGAAQAVPVPASHELRSRVFSQLDAAAEEPRHQQVLMAAGTQQQLMMSAGGQYVMVQMPQMQMQRAGTQYVMVNSTGQPSPYAQHALLSHGQLVLQQQPTQLSYMTLPSPYVAGM